MKKILLLNILLIATAGIFGENIVDLYHSLPENLEASGCRYQLKYKKPKWFAKTCMDEEEPAIVDIPNGFMRIENDTGGGVGHTQVALFKSSDKTAFLMLTHYNSEGAILYDDATLMFLERIGNKWKRIEDPIKVSKKDFFPGISEQLLRKKRTNLRLIYFLPRQGTEVQVRLHIDHENESPDKSQSEAATKVQAEFSKAQKFDRIFFAWDRTRKKFFAVRQCLKESCAETP